MDQEETRSVVYMVPQKLSPILYIMESANLRKIPLLDKDCCRGILIAQEPRCRVNIRAF